MTNGYASAEGKWLQTTIPTGIAKAQVKMSSQNGVAVLKVDFASTVALGKDRMIFAAYFGDTKSQRMTEGVVATFNSAAYGSRPKLTGTRAAVVNLADFKFTRTAELAKSEKGFEIRFPSSELNGHELLHAMVVYLPASVPKEQTLGDLSGAEQHELFTVFTGPGSIALPRVP